MLPLWVYIGGWFVTVAGFIFAGAVAWRNVNVQIAANQKVFEENHMSELRGDFQHRLELFSNAFEKHKSEDLDLHQRIQGDIGEIKTSVGRIEGRLNGR
jgi:hypothetical protein